MTPNDPDLRLTHMITAEVGPNAGTVRGRKRHLLRNIPSFCFRFTPEIKKQREGWNKEPHRKQKGGEFAEKHQGSDFTKDLMKFYLNDNEKALFISFHFYF